MIMRCIKLALCLLPFTACFAQEPVPKAGEKWDLRRCVEYALENNITIKQAGIQAQFSALDLKESKASRWPTLNFSGSGGYSFGLSENSTTGTLENRTLFNIGGQLQSQVTLFNWFSRRNSIAANQLAHAANVEQTHKVENDIALNVAVAYLQILLAKEQVNLSRIQVQQTMSQLESTRKQVDAGQLPELNAAQLEAQLANDSSALISSETSQQQFILQLKALLNLDAGLPFDVDTPPVEFIPVESLSDLQPESVYASAMANLPQQKVNELRIQSAIKNVAVAKAAMYPSISAFGGLETRYVQFKMADYTKIITGYTIIPGFRADAGSGNYYTVEQATYVNGPLQGYIRADRFGRQIRDNFGQNLGIGLSIPIFNGRRARTAWERSKLTVRDFELTKEQGDQQLKQDIYKAYIDATAAIEKFNANKRGVATSQKAYDFARKRYDLDLLSTYELLNAQNILLTAKTQLLYAQYDYVFKMKLLEFYKGQGLKL